MTPRRPVCRRQTPLASVQDFRTSTVSAVVSLASSAGQVIGATDSTGQEGGEGGTYAAAKLKPSGIWSEGGDSGSFNYSYPITLPAASTQLVPDVTLHSHWQAQADDGAVITHVSDAGTVFGAYSLGQDYWTVTERDGTKYEFGRQHLPGWASTDAATNSVDTMPVFSAHSGDPCYSSSGFASSVCPMAYAWHLDYVVDPHAAAMAYYYTQATNYYGEDNGAKNVSYVADSYLDHIDYGFVDGGAYGTVPDKVVFGTGSRCVASTCGALSKSNPAYKDVDGYTFSQTEPASGDGLSPTLWLASIEHVGDDTSAGGSSAPITLPLVTFAGVDLPNRVITSDFPGLYRYRISAITTELGAVTSVEYGTPKPCSSSYSSSSTSAVTSANNHSCFPVYWTPQGSPGPVLDWFESYAVTQVLTADQTGGSLAEETDYAYGTTAWHYDDNEVVQPSTGPGASSARAPGVDHVGREHLDEAIQPARPGNPEHGS